MDSWVLEGDSYSFLRSAPRNFNLQHQDGPNRVEIFDITSIQSHRRAISETTCLCDIFGDDSESPSLSSSPASASFLKKDTDEQLPVEDVNDSSGSYHTANGSEHLSDGSEIYEDSKDTKDLVLSETLESNVQASDLPVAAHECDAPAPAPIRNWQESDLSQHTNLAQVENSSDHQLATSTSEFRDTNIRVTGSPQEIFCPELLSENKTITDQSHATSFELRKTDSSEEIITHNLRHITKQRDAFSSEQKKKDSAENIITPDSSLENGSIIEKRGTMTSEVREPDTAQENKYYKQSIFSENQTSSESYPSNLTSEDSTQGNNDQGCLIEEGEKISLPDILSIENSLLVCGTVKSDSSVALTNFSNDGSVFTSLQKAGVSDRSAQDNMHDLTEMSTPLEHEDVPNELAYAGGFLCDDEEGMSDLPDPNTEPLPDYIEENTKVDVGYMPQDFNISSDTSRTLSSFSDPREELVSSVISEVYTPSGFSVDVNFPELPVIIHSPVGFTICPSPEPESRGFSEELAFTPRTPESDYRLTPTDKGSVSSFDSSLCPTPEPRSISSTSDNRQNFIICHPSPAASSLELRSASCSPEIQITPCSFLPSQNDFSSPDEVLDDDDLDGIIHAEMSTLPTKEAGDFSIPIIYNLSSAQDATSSLSILPRDTVSPGVKERCIESPTLNILPANEITNILSNLSIGPHSTLTTESPDVHKIPSVESCISTISSANETISPDSNLLPSTEGNIYRSPSTLGIPRDTPSFDIVGTGFSESSVSTTSPTKDIEKSEFRSPTLQPLLTEGGISRPPLNLPTPIDTASPDVDGLICVKSATSTTLLANETTIMAILPHSPTLSNVSIRKDTMHPDVEETRYPQTPVSTMLPIKEITPIPHISSKEGGSPRSVSTLSIPEDTVSPDVAGRCVESFMPTVMPTNETTNMFNLLISNSSSTVSGISRPSSSLNIPIQCNTASYVIDGLGCVEIPTSAAVLTDKITNTANSPIDPSLTEGISRPPSNLIISRDTMCLDAQVTKYPEGSNEISMNKMTNMAIFDHSTDEETSRPASTSIDVDLLRCVQCPTSSILPPNEAPNMGISPVFNISSNISPTEGCLCNPPSTLGIPKDTMFPEVEGRRNPEKLNEIPINEITNINILPLISNLSSTERELSRPPSTSSILRNTSSADVEALRYIESPTSTILPTNEVSNTGISPVFNISSTVGGSSTSPSSLSLPRVTMSSNIKERRHTETLIEMPTNETTNLPNSLIISNPSSTEKEISRPQSISNISRNTSIDVDALRPTSTSIDVDILKCVGSATSTILPTNQAPNMGISSFFNISSTVGGSSTPPLALCLPRDAMSLDVDGRRTSNGITTLANSTMLPTNISSIENISSTAGGTVRRQSSNLGLPSDSTFPGVQGTIYVERSNEVPTNDNKSMASSISSFTTPSVTLTDRVSRPEISYQRTPDRFNDYIPTPEYTHNHLSTTVNEKVDLRSMVSVDRGQIDYTGSKISLKYPCSLPQDDCMDNNLVHCSQTEKISEMSPEPPAPKLSVKQIKESWERMNESILNSLKPWQTSKKKAKEAKERNDIGREMLQRESAGSEKTFRQMAVRPGESPSVLHSSDHTMYEGQSCRNKGWSGERVLQEECTLGRGVGNIAEGSHRGEQVELSFSTRNRKGPAHHSPTPPSRDPKSGIPPRYFESPLATRRQQSLLRAQNIQKENKTGARRVRSTSQSNPCAAGRLFSECTSETSSMGSEFDDSDCEVKWLTDQAFRSLSSPRVDYLDVYNSSRGSSTNVSQPSTTMDSPGSATWITYADLHDSLHKNEEVLRHPSPFLPHGTLDPAKRFEMSSFECVDVALESKEETRRGKRTVPKRQIQFKKRNDDELKSTENEGSAMDLLSTETCSMNTFVRQHSTPASMQEDLLQGKNEIQTGKKMLQKSASLDESSPKSKMASSVIKNVLSKKIDAAPKEPSRSEPCENKNEHVKTLTSGDSCNLETHLSSLPSVCSLPSEDFAGKEERSPYTQKRIRGPKVPPKPAFKPTFLPPNNIPVDAAFQDNNLMKDQLTPIKVDTLESKLSKKQSFGSSEKEASKVGDKYNSHLGSAINQTTNCTAICVASTQRRMTTSDNKHPMTPETCKQLEGSSSMFLSKTPEITLKPCTIKDKNKSSLKASVCPDSEISKDSICEPVLELKETVEEQKTFKTGGETDTEEDNENNKAKSVIHKVRDVRKLVKNTYNLSFKASNNTNLEEDVVPEKQKEMQPEHLHSLQIECKAISLKDKSASSNKSTMQQDAGPFADTAKIPQTDSLIREGVGITKAFVPNIQHSDMDLFVGLDKSNNIPTTADCEEDTNLEMPSRPSSKEVSTLVFLQDGAPKSVQKPPSPAFTDVKTANSSHSVSMLRKEKGMQADIGVCDVLSEGTGSKLKHINRLEVPLQTYASEGNFSESRKVKKVDADSPPEQKKSLNSGLQSSGVTSQVRSSSKPKEVRALPNGKERDNQSQQALKEDISVVSSSKAEVRAFSSSKKIHAMPVTTSKEIELPIQVRSISSDRAKPSVLPKPSYKQPFAEIRSTSTDLPKSDNTPTTSILKEQTHLQSDVEINDVKTSTAVKHNEQTTNTASSNIKTLAVSAVSSHKPQTIPYTISSAQKSTATSSKQEVSITSMQNSSNKQQQNIQEQVMVATSCASNYQTLSAASQANTYIQPEITSSSNKQLHKNDFHFPTSDDPPSYDERESFSPLQLSDLPSRRQNRYHPTTKHSLCSCTACTNPQFGQPYHGSQNQTPPVPRSPSQVTSYTGAPPQAQVRPHQCRTDGQPSTYPSLSPKTTVQQTPAMIQPIHHSHTCPAPAIQPFGNEQQQPSTQHMDRRSGNQRSPQAPSGATYREHSRSPNIACLDPRSQFFNPQELPPVFGNEYGSDGSGNGGMLYPENASGLGYGQGPRRVLLDPETGKYFYIEVPMQPLRKMLFDPEIGQYVEVLIPQQALSNSSMYPPTAAPYQGPYHGQGLYTSQYLPYAMPPQTQSAQQPRHPEPSVPTSLHQNTMGYGSSASQAPKSEVKGHPSLNQGYLESMYYIPTGMNASPNSTPSDCYHKPATNMPAATGGRRA